MDVRRAVAICVLGVLAACGGGGGGSNDADDECSCIAAPEAAVPGSTPIPTRDVSDWEATQLELVLARINAERAAREIPPVAWHETAAQVAYDHSQWMLTNQTLSHEEPGTCEAGEQPPCPVQRTQRLSWRRIPRKS